MGSSFWRFAVDEAAGWDLAEVLRSLGFQHAGRRKSKSVDLYRQGRLPRGRRPRSLEVMAAAHERPVGLWHAEWNALPSLFGLASLSGALREARTLAEGLVVDAGQMRANIDAAARRLAPKLGREAADRFEQAAEQVLKTRTALYDVLAGNSKVRDTAWT